jgi:transcription initiation protein SPT3
MSSTTTNDKFSSGKGYRYCQEIGQMCFVFTKLNEIDQQVLIQIEQIIKFQLIQLIIKATSSSTSSSSRQLTIQNILFILRKDNQKLNRLINHLASNNVTKKLKDDEPDDAIHSIQDPDIGKLNSPLHL